MRSKILRGAITFIGAWSLLAGCAAAGISTASQSGFRIEQVTYTPADWPQPLGADIYVPEAAAAITRFPGVLVVHGGGWEGRNRDMMNELSAKLTQHGYVVMNISHRFAPEYIFPAQLHDLQQALRWLRQHADSYQLDAKRIGAFGYSSGGHLAALLGGVSQGDALDQPYGGAETRLQAVVAGGAPTDLRKYTGGRLVPQFLGSTIDQNPAAFAAASPVTQVTGDDPPMFFYHGSADSLVDISHAEDMQRALITAGVTAELYVIPLAGHVTAFLFDGEAVAAAIQFLDRTLRNPSTLTTR